MKEKTLILRIKMRIPVDRFVINVQCTLHIESYLDYTIIVRTSTQNEFAIGATYLQHFLLKKFLLVIKSDKSRCRGSINLAMGASFRWLLQAFSDYLE